MTPQSFVTALQSVKLGNVFNLYADRCALYDVSNAPARRAQSLLCLLTVAADTEIEDLWIGRDLGYRGGRRTGLALTDDIHLNMHRSRWNVQVQRAKMGEMVAERTAAVVWKMLDEVSAAVFLWNVFPFHPHLPNEPFSNRAHRSCERAVGEEILSELIAMLRPRRLIAIGNDAARSASNFVADAEVVQVRHPSYGGQRDLSVRSSKCIVSAPEIGRLFQYLPIADCPSADNLFVIHLRQDIFWELKNRTNGGIQNHAGSGPTPARNLSSY
jgi:hypothetical protein